MEQSSHFFWRYPLALAAVLVLSACGKAPETTQGMAVRPRSASPKSSNNR